MLKQIYFFKVILIRAIAFKRIQGGVEDFVKNARREGGSKR